VGPFRHSRCDGGENHLHHAVGVLQNIVIPEPDYLPPQGFEPRGALIVIEALVMLAAIQLDYEPGSPARKVGDRVPNHELPGEARPILAKNAP